MILVAAMCLTALTACLGNNDPSGEDVAVTAVKLNKDALTLDEGASETLTATVEPSNATDKTVTWSTSNAAVATVANGKVTAVAAGTATITAKAGDKTATCAVTVKVPVDYTVTESEWTAAFDDFAKNCMNFTFAKSFDGHMKDYFTEQYIYGEGNSEEEKGCFVKRSYGFEMYYFDAGHKKWLSRGPNTGGDGIETNIDGMWENYYSVYKDFIVYVLPEILEMDNDSTLADIAKVLYSKSRYNATTEQYECSIKHSGESIRVLITVSFDANKALSLVKVTTYDGGETTELMSLDHIGTTDIELPFDVNESDVFVKGMAALVTKEEDLETLVNYFNIKPSNIPNDVKFSAMFGKCTYNEAEQRYEYIRRQNNQPNDQGDTYTVYIGVDDDGNISYVRAFKQDYAGTTAEEVNLGNTGTSDVCA